MKQLIKPYATPLTISTSLIVLGTGAFMEFAFKNKTIEEIHAQVGIVLMIATILHLIVNWAPLKNHFKKKNLYLLAIIPLILIGVQLTSAPDQKGMSPGLLFKKLENAKISTVSDLFQKDVESIKMKLEKEGIKIESNEQSISDIANKNQSNPRKILEVFNQ